MRTQGPLAQPRICEGRYAFAQLAEQVAPGGAFQFGLGLDVRLHIFLLASSSALIIALSALRCCAVKSDISSLS